MELNKRYIDAVHYIIKTCEKKTQLSATQLNRILFLTDGFLYKKNGKTLTGESYFRKRFVVYPKDVLKVRNELASVNKIALEKATKPYSLVSLKMPTTPALTIYEKKVLAYLGSYISEYTPREIRQILCTPYFETLEIGSKIDLYNYFIANEKEAAKEDIVVAKTLIRAYK